MTTILLLSLILAGMFLCWMITLYQMEYWRNRALYAEALEHARNRDQQWHANLNQLWSQPRKPTETEK